MSEIRIADSLEGIDRAEWDALAGEQPFLKFAFFKALHDSGCVSEKTGWSPRFPTLWENGKLIGAAPLYLKTHSWGEYVFDWAWAQAYGRCGLDYYPKLVCAVPFTPVSGPRFLAQSKDARNKLLEAALDLVEDLGASSFHCLFPGDEESSEMEGQGMILRSGIQFHWKNQGYADFEDYLGEMNHEKRKKIKQERKKVHAGGITFERNVGKEIKEEDWVFFDLCYRNTYSQHRSTPYLNLEFFLRLGESLPNNILMVTAFDRGKPIASALNLFDDNRLYGRYWGSIGYFPGLHFETCYYQALEFCIEKGISLFEGGAQGVHKLARGFLPSRTVSAHWLAHPEFYNAVEKFVCAETEGISHHFDELSESSPFKNKNLPAG